MVQRTTRQQAASSLQKVADVSSASIAKLAKDDNLQIEVFAKTCAALDCGANDIIEFE
jgi:DNA-binding Xre family transcriptional regulator